MIEDKLDATPSFIPYLDARHHGLRIKLKFDETRAEAPCFIEGAGPFAKILDAAVVGEDEIPISGIFLLVQPDHYPPPGELASVTNDHVEALWRNAFARQAATRHNRCPAPAFLQKVDDLGLPAAFRSLLFCRHKQRYAEALCPACGDLLTLCRDDEALASAGLPAYGHCLERYLYCPGCHAGSESGLFYTNNLPDPAPGNLQGKIQLFEGYRRLLTREDLEKALPCVGCNEAAHCYGPKTLVADRMDALIFYPFYVIALPAPTVNSIDFLTLLSGGTEDALRQQLTRQKKTGRLQRVVSFLTEKNAGDGLIFESDSRRILEVLYLKLSFLRELLDLLMDDSLAVSAPESGFSLESIWVHLSGSGRLPLFWNFSLEFVDKAGCPPRTATPTALRKAQTIHFFASAWFYVLLVNGRQGMDAVDNALVRVSDRPSAEISFEAEPVFSSQNLLWDAHAWQPDEKWQALWQQALVIGIELLQASAEPVTADSGDDRFASRIDRLCKAVHQMLFQQPAATVEATHKESEQGAGPSDLDIDQAIVDILKNILTKMPRFEEIDSTIVPQDTAYESEKSDIQANEDGDFEETVILKQPTAAQKVSVQDPAQTVLPDHGQLKSGAKKSRDEMEATIVVTPAPRNGVDTPPSEPLEKTVVLKAPLGPDDQSQGLDQTVVINPAEKSSDSANAAAAESPPPSTPEKAQPAPADDLPETVIIQPERAKDRKDKP